MTHRMMRVVLQFSLLALSPVLLSANTYTVSNTNDWFLGSLRWAIQDANGHAGPDTIVFAIGNGPKTIKLDTELPIITDEVTVDGWTQPGWTGNPIIELDGTKVTTGSGLLVAAPGVTIRGLVINRFGRNGIGIGDDFVGHVPSGTIIQGCWIGVGLDGATGLMNGRDGIRVYANDCLIGGEGPHQANVLSFNAENGISIGIHPWTSQRSSGRGLRNRVQSNIIGLDATGTIATANSKRGVEVAMGTDNLIGGDAPAEGNIISANGGQGILIDSEGAAVAHTRIKYNKIGVSKTGTRMGNGYWGGSFAGVAVFGPDATITQNVIANNILAGVEVAFGSGTAIVNNSIVDNVGRGIVLHNGGNSSLIYPTISAAVHEGSQTRVTGDYVGAANQAFTLEFYANGVCDPSGYGEGETYLGSQMVVTNASGVAHYSLLLPATGIGIYISTTARDAWWSTSEFSPCRQTTFPPPAVTGMTPAGGRVGTPVTIGGTNLLLINYVKFFDGVGNNISVPFTVNGTTITTAVPAGAKIGPIAVIGAFGTAMIASFRATPPTGDFDGDGRPDLVWRNYSTGQNSIWTTGGPGDGVALTAVPDVNWQIEGTGDFNNDGSHDIVWRNATTGDNGIWLMTGTTMTGWAALPSVTDPNLHIVAIGDFDRDGDPDIVWRNSATGDQSIWIMNGTSWSGNAAPLPNVPVEWKIEAAGDFNLDGSADLLWRNYTTGEVVIWFMNGTTEVSFTNLQNVGDPNWTIEAAGDWDQDGDLDIVWRNLSTGQNTVWLLIGPFWGGAYVDLAPLNDANWRIEDF